MDAATEPDQVEKLREIWHAGEIDSDIDYYLTVAAHAPWVVRPHVVHLERDGRDLLGIARLEKYALRINAGHRAFARPELRSIVVTFGGIVGCRDIDDELSVIDALSEPLRTGEAEALVLQRVRRPSTLWQASQRRLRVYGLPVAHRSVAKKPASLEAFLASRSSTTRRRFQKEDKRLESEHRVEVVRYDSVEQADVLAQHMEAIAAKTYQRAIGTGHRGDTVDAALIRLCLAKGWLRVWMLYLDGKPVAFWEGTTYGGRYLGGVTGYDPEYARKSVGRYTMHRMVAEVCADPAVEVIDLGQGDQEYKLEFQPDRIDECDVILLARRPRALALGAALSATTVANTLGKRISRSEAAAKVRARLKTGR
ncbi:MAG TPA: GNAT family N-acetyltransferase [Micromonosporaceae bacterium]